MGSLVLRAPFSGKLPPPAPNSCSRTVLAEAWTRLGPGSPLSHRLGQPGVLDLRAVTRQRDALQIPVLSAPRGLWLQAQEWGEMSGGPAAQTRGQKYIHGPSVVLFWFLLYLFKIITVIKCT